MQILQTFAGLFSNFGNLTWQMVVMWVIGGLLIYLAIASITNIVLDIVLVAILRMGIAGAAIATVFSQFISCVFSMRFLLKTNESYQVSLKKIRFHKMVCIRIIKVGLPAGIQNTVIAISNVLVQASVNGFGATPMAGFGAYLKVDGFNILPVMSISMAVTTFTGQNFGAGKLDRVKKGMNKTLWIGIIYTIVTGALILFFADPPDSSIYKSQELNKLRSYVR